jgi:nicotinamide mononucleotide transporter
MIDIIATTLSIVGIILNAKKIIWCWHIWILSNIFWIIYSISTQQWSQLILWVAFLIFNFYGYFQWKKT